ncbi:MAG: thioredoxin domain-containing protein [Actinobacteria bacterium]|nr:thioredoxin domain-containing protein [Actinomycetota bacterium]
MPNLLSNETSPYLLQHADNPVDWYPWGDEAFAAAKAEGKPVLLSVGYSSCHWCHVMAHESFEDPETAALMNKLFVNIKVDREERPDVDAVYMEALQAMSGRGGWPMTVFLTPDRKPFHAGTYFPAVERHGMPSFRRVITAVADAWETRRAELTAQAERLSGFVGQAIPSADELPGEDLLVSSYQALASRFDETEGGFGEAPKFPQEPVLEFLLRVADEPWAPDAKRMVWLTLSKMADGGIHDHVGGGFARYSVDRSWTIPHFEKMLYTNAQLARLYLHSAQVLHEPAFTAVAIRTLDYLLRDLRLPGGAFASAEDADSQGSEGTFYVWDAGEFADAVGDELAPLATTFFGVTEDGNFEGSNHLHVTRPLGQLASQLNIDLVTADAMIDTARRRLLSRRSERVRPGLDDKVVTAWNGLAIRSFAEAGAVLGEPRLLDAARDAATFLLSEVTRADGRLLRSWGKGRASVPAFADDYAATALGLFTLYQATGEVSWYTEAMRLVEGMVDLFADPAGGFFTTGADVEAPLARTRDHFDSPSPSANALAAEALLLASSYTGDAEFAAYSERALRAGATLAITSPSGAGHLLSVLHTTLSKPQEVAIVGPDAQELSSVVWERFRPGVALAVDRDGSATNIVPLLEGRATDSTLAYVCRDFHCALPVSDPEALRRLL